MSFWIHTCLRAGLRAYLTWLAALLMTVGGLCVQVCVRTACSVRHFRGSSRISRGAAFREPVLVCLEVSEGIVPSEGAGGAAQVTGGVRACPGCPQPWRLSAAVPSAVVGRGPACEAVHELRIGAAGYCDRARKLSTPHLPPIPAEAGIQRCGREVRAVCGRLAHTCKSETRPGLHIARRPRGWIPAFAGMSGRGESGCGRVENAQPQEVRI